MMNMTAITYPHVTVNTISGENLKNLLEDICDNLFNPDPYYQQGGDMVRTGGLTYTCEPGAKMGNRIQDMRLNGKLIEADKTYKVAGWAPVAEASKNAGPPVWDVVETYLKAKKVIKPVKPNTPQLVGVAGNAGLA
jgi:sulfur-oxidizing protein SoxB